MLGKTPHQLNIKTITASGDEIGKANAQVAQLAAGANFRQIRRLHRQGT